MVAQDRSSISSPSFLVIGAQKAGTTWFFKNLRAHPEVWLPREKELHYFDEKRGSSQSLAANLLGRDARSRRWRRQLSRQVSGLIDGFSVAELKWSARYLLRAPSDAWYVSLFERAAGHVTGEMTPAYSTLTADQVARLNQLLPDAKIVFFMRHPVERAWSQEVMEVRQVRRGGTSSDVDVLENASSILRTDYVRTIDVWSASFPPERIFVAFLDDVSFHPEELLRRLTHFLGLSELSNWPDARRRVFQSDTKEMPAAAARRLAGLYAGLVEELARRYGGHAEWWLYSTNRLREGALGEVVPYPLSVTPLWEEWVARQPLSIEWEDRIPPCQSATLEALTGAGQIGAERAADER